MSYSPTLEAILKGANLDLSQLATNPLGLAYSLIHLNFSRRWIDIAHKISFASGYDIRYLPAFIKPGLLVRLANAAISICALAVALAVLVFLFKHLRIVAEHSVRSIVALFHRRWPEQPIWDRDALEQAGMFLLYLANTALYF